MCQSELIELPSRALHHLLGSVSDFDQRLRSGFAERELATLRDLLQRLAANVAGDPTTHEEQ